MRLFLSALLCVSMLIFVPQLAAAEPTVQQPSPSAQMDDRWDDNDDHPCSHVKLTAEQTKKLQKLADKQYKIHQEMIGAYTEFDLLSKDQKHHMLSTLDRYMTKLKEHGYIACMEVKEHEIEMEIAHHSKHSHHDDDRYDD